MRQQAAERVGIHTICWITAADLSLELEDGLPKRVVLEEQPRFQLGLTEPEIGIDRHHPRIDIQAY